MESVVLEHRDDATRPKHPSHVADGNDRIGEGVEALGTPHEVERVVSKRQPVEGACDKVDSRVPAIARRRHAGFGEVGQIHVHTDDGPSEPQPLRDAPSVESVARSEIEHSHLGAEGQLLHDRLQFAPEGSVKSR